MRTKDVEDGSGMGINGLVFVGLITGLVLIASLLSSLLVVSAPAFGMDAHSKSAAQQTNRPDFDIEFTGIVERI